MRLLIGSFDHHPHLMRDNTQLYGFLLTETECSCGYVGDAGSLGLIAASCAAAVLLQSTPVDAKVIFEPVQAKKVCTGLRAVTTCHADP